MIELKKHNKKPYKKVVDNLYRNSQTLYVSGVGTGKSYILMKLAEKEFLDKKILCIVPKNSIKENYYLNEDFIKFNNIDFISIQQFSSKEKAINIFKQYDLVVMDEAHHIVSDVYGKNVLSAIDAKSTLFLGLTATPIRANGYDVRSEFASVVEGISNFDAIKLGIMKPFHYIIGCAETLENYREISNGRTMRDYYECRDIIKNINDKSPKNKYIVFSSDIESSKNDMKTIQYAFPDKEIFVLNSKEKNTKNIIRKFNHTDNAVLMTVNMACEGIHLNGVEGIILFRNVQSIPLFEQMLGRVCYIDNEIEPTVIDCSARGLYLLNHLIEINNNRWNNLPTQEKEELEKLYMELNSVLGVEKDIPVSATPSSVKIKTEVVPRNIMSISLGSTRQWDDISDFTKEWAKVNQKAVRTTRNQKIDKAVKMYMNGKNMYDNLEEEQTAKIKEIIASNYKITLQELENGIMNKCEFEIEKESACS